MAYRKPACYGISSCLLGLALGGCATTASLPLAQSGLHLPTKVAVTEAPLAADRERLQSVLAPEAHRKLSRSDHPIARGIEHAQKFALAAMTQALGKHAEFDVVALPPGDEPSFRTTQSHPTAAGLSQAAADRIRTDTGADALLRFRITDYGLTPKAWRKGYIAFEVTTTLALGAAIAYSHIPAAKAAASAYLAQETVEETAEAYAGFWALNVMARPVRMEAEFIRLDPVATVWTDSDTGLSEFKWSRLTRTVSPAERAGQLDRATDDAAGDIASDLAQALGSTEPASVW